jgi:hypothetical protein
VLKINHLLILTTCRYPNAGVYFLNASSEASLKADLETLIRSLGNNNRTKSFDAALQWLATKVKDWLVIMDNADDPSFPVFRYTPKCTHGNVIITTRNANHATLAPNSTYHLEELSMEDAIDLILTASRSENTEVNRAFATKIVLKLGRLPLALAQAAGYIFVHHCLSTYLDIYQASQKELLESMDTQLPNDYQTSVAATIAMSLKRLPPPAQDMMRLFAHLDSTSIARDIIAKSASRQFRKVVETTESEIQPQTREHAAALMKIFSPSGNWSEAEFNKLITKCLQYSLLRVSTEGEAHFYSMHILVQSYLRANPDGLQGHQSSSLVARLIGSSVTYSATYEYMAFNRLILPHLRLIRLESVAEAGDHFGFARALRGVGDDRLSVIHQERCVEMWWAALGEEHGTTLRAMMNLAIFHKGIGNSKKALNME